MEKKIITLLLLLVSFVSVSYSQTSAYSYPKQVTSYVQPYNTDMLYEIAREKQARYDHNLNLVVDKIEELRDVFAYIDETNGGFTKGQNECIASINKCITSFDGDLSDNSVTRNLLGFLNKCISIVKTWEEE